MSLRRVALALPLLALACSAPAAPQPASKADLKDLKAEADAKPAKPARAPVKKLPPKIAPPPELAAKDLPAAPSLPSVTLERASEGKVALPEGLGVVLPHVALQLGEGLLLGGQGFIVYDPQIRATEIWQVHVFVPTQGEARAFKGESGSIRSGTRDAEGGALLVGSTGVGMGVQVWATRVTAKGEAGPPLSLGLLGYSDVLATIGGGSEGELASLAGFADASAWLVSLDAAGAKRWQPPLDEREGFPQLRALARVEGGGVLGVGVVAQREGDPWWVRVAADGSEQARGRVVEFEGTPPDRNRTLYAIVDRGAAGFVALGLAKRAVAQDHDQVFAVGFDGTGNPSWARAIEGVRAKSIRGAQAHGDEALFVLEVPGEAGGAVALLHVGGEQGETTRAEQIAGSEGKRSAGFVQGAATPELLLAGIEGELSWQRTKVSP